MYGMQADRLLHIQEQAKVKKSLGAQEALRKVQKTLTPQRDEIEEKKSLSSGDFFLCSKEEKF